MTGSDEELVADLKKGRISAFQELYERHKDGMLRLALRILRNRADAEDAVQDAFIALYRSIGLFRGASSFPTWLYRIVVNACRKIGRSRRRTEALEEELIPFAWPDKPEIHEAARALDRALDGLPLRQRMVFTLAEVEGFSLEETAEILSLQGGTARYHLFMAKKKLRERLRPFLEEPDPGRGRTAEPRGDRNP